MFVCLFSHNTNMKWLEVNCLYLFVCLFLLIKKKRCLSTSLPFLSFLPPSLSFSLFLHSSLALFFTLFLRGEEDKNSFIVTFISTRLTRIKKISLRERVNAFEKRLVSCESVWTAPAAEGSGSHRSQSSTHDITHTMALHLPLELK